MKTHNSFATCASSSNWTTVIENLFECKGDMEQIRYIFMDTSGPDRHGVV